MICNDDNILIQQLVVDLNFPINPDLDLFSTRRYFYVNYKDGSEKLIFTTNELDYYEPEIVKALIDFNLDDEYIKEYTKENDYLGVINESYEEITDFNHLVKSFENSSFLDYYLKKGINMPPKYIYYDISYINEALKPMFLEHLTNCISAYNSNDLTKDDEFKIYIWKEYLTQK